jgi:hypothetical protein
MYTGFLQKNSKEQKIFHSLAGNWSINFRLEGMYFDEQRLHIGKGTACFKQLRDNKLFYREDLFINNSLDQSNFQVYRTYFYCFDPNEETINIFFAHSDKEKKPLLEIFFIIYPLQFKMRHFSLVSS